MSAQSNAAAPSSSDQTAQSSAATSSSSDQTAQQNEPSSTAGNEAQSNATSGQENAGANLPQTASPLPLLGLLGLGSIGAGLLTRKKKH
jgi:LPXTG-motif cell wall-anchored protein